MTIKKNENSWLISTVIIELLICLSIVSYVKLCRRIVSIQIQKRMPCPEYVGIPLRRGCDFALRFAGKSSLPAAGRGEKIYLTIGFALLPVPLDVKFISNLF